MRENLSIRLEILRYLAAQAVGGEGPPSVREVGDAVGLKSSQTAFKHLGKLEESSYIEKRSGRARGVRLTQRGWEAVCEMPLMGRVAAGRGLEAILDEESYSLVAEFFGSRLGKERYTLRVVGQSMRGAGIEEGDLLIVEEDEDPPDGSVVVALLGGGEEVTVKRLFREGESLRLKPENGDHEDLLLPAGDVILQGQVVYVVHPPRSRRFQP